MASATRQSLVPREQLNCWRCHKVATGLDRGRALGLAAFLRSDETERHDLFRRAVAEYRKYFSESKETGQEGHYAGVLWAIAGSLHGRYPDEAEKLCDESITLWRELDGRASSRDNSFYFVRSLLTQARFLRIPSRDQSNSFAARVAKAELLFQEAISTQRQIVSRFALREDEYDLVKMLVEESDYLFGQVAGAALPEDAAARKLQGQALRDEALLMAGKLDPRTAAEYVARANLHVKVGQAPQALADFEKALALDPTNIASYQGRAEVYTAQKQYDRALADRTRAVELDPTSARKLVARGKLLARMNNDEPALRDFSRAIEIAPDDVEALVDRGVLYTRAKEYELAIADYTHVIDLDPSRSWVKKRRAIPRIHAGQYDEALADLRDAAPSPAPR